MFSKFILKNALIWSLTLSFLTTIYSTPALAQSGRYNNGHMGPWMMGNWGMGWFGMILTLLFWILVVVGIVALIRWLFKAPITKEQYSASTGSRAMEILKERYSRGEITSDEFQSMKKEILL